MLIYQLGLPPLSVVSPESSDGKGMMRKGGSVFPEYRKTYKADQRLFTETPSGIYNSISLCSFHFKVTATSAKST